MIIVGVGIGVSEGVGVGEGDGDWARAEGIAIVNPRTNAIATALASQRPTPLSVVREGRDEQHINAIPKTGAGSTNAQNLIGFALVLAEGQSLRAGGKGIARHCGSSATGWLVWKNLKLS